MLERDLAKERDIEAAAVHSSLGDDSKPNGVLPRVGRSILGRSLRTKGLFREFAFIDVLKGVLTFECRFNLILGAGVYLAKELIPVWPFDEE